MTKCNDIKYVDDKEVVYVRDNGGIVRVFCQTEDKATFIVNFLTSLGIVYEQGNWEGTLPPYFEADGQLLAIEFLDEEWEIFKESLGLFDIVLEERDD